MTQEEQKFIKLTNKIEDRLKEINLIIKGWK